MFGRGSKFFSILKDKLQKLCLMSFANLSLCLHLIYLLRFDIEHDPYYSVRNHTLTKIVTFINHNLKVLKLDLRLP